MVRLKGTSKVNSRTRKVGAAVTAAASVAAGMAFATAPATATAATDTGATDTAAVAEYPVSHFRIESGASYYRGTVTWYNRSADVNGTANASGCRRYYGRAFAGSTSLDFKSSSTWCNRSGNVRLPLNANVVGGADRVWVYMTDENQNLIKGQTCYRGYTSCYDGLR
ncbi:hypothetical protein [Streptomyces sp. NPDC029674]|uniref:hypothetical protein n=1 Tax=Streptomyces sp. NPDC029674 TaxID=3365297 RepID=UPI00384DB7EE